MMRPNPGLHGVTVGQTVVTALNDGQFEAPAAWAAVDAADLERILVANFRVFPPRITLNAFLLEQGGRKILVDAGAGNKFGPGMGRVGGALRSLGVAPEAIDTILLTHAHTDHVGGLTDEAGAAVFSRAELVMSQAEHDHWRDEAELAAAPEGAREGFHAARAALDAYKTHTRFVADGQEAVPGVTARFLPGHTPGHTGFQVGKGAESLLLWGDIVHLPGVQFAHPEIGMVFDTDPAQAIATRKAIFDEVIATRGLVGGMHLDFPTFCNLRRHGDQVEFIPHVWAPNA